MGWVKISRAFFIECTTSSLQNVGAGEQCKGVSAEPKDERRAARALNITGRSSMQTDFLRVFSRIYFFTSPHSYPILSHPVLDMEKNCVKSSTASGAGLYGYWSGGWRFVSSPVPGLERHLTDLHWRPPRRPGATAGWDWWERRCRIKKTWGLMIFNAI